MRLEDIFNKQLSFDRKKAYAKIEELIKEYTIDEKQKNDWSNNIIWSETKNSFAIEGESVKASLYTKYLNDNATAKEKENIFAKYKEAINDITHSKTNLSEESIFDYFIKLGNSHQLKHAEGFDGFYRKGQVYLTSNYMYQESGKGLDNPAKYMDYLIKYLNQDNLDDIEIIINALIAHIQFANIHPYYDMNGRMARMLNIWVAMNSKYNYLFHFLSQSIHFTKPKYYQAIDQTINKDKIYLNNFINYICDALITNNKAWNLLKGKMDTNDFTLTETEKDWALLILTNFPSVEFGWRDLKRNLSATVTKQYLIPILNKLTDLGILERQERKNTYFYKIKKDHQ